MSRRLPVLFGLTMAFVLVGSAAAFATTCSPTHQVYGGPGYYYSIEQSLGTVWDGIYGQIPTDSLTINGAAHQLLFNGAHGGSLVCKDDGLHKNCTMLTGYGWGVVHGMHSSGSGLNLIMEEEDVNAYDVVWNPFGATPGANNNALLEYSGTNDVNGNGRWDAYIYPNNGTAVLTGHAFYPPAVYQFMQVNAEYEVNYDSSGTCAGLSSYQYFGALQDGTFNSLTYVYETESYAPYSWEHWAASNTSGPAVVDAPYQVSQLGSGSRAGYKAWGF